MTPDDATPDDATPVLAIDLDAVATAYRTVRDALPDTAVHYAMKCNPHPDILRTLHALGGRFEIASVDELYALLAIGVDPDEIIYSSPVKPARHIATAFAAGVRQFTFDSADELAKLAVTAPGSAVFVRLATCDTPSEVPSEGKFGVDATTAVTLLLAARALGLRPYGLTFHVGSQMLDPSAWDAPLRLAGDVADKLLVEGVTLETIDLGGGFPARYDTAPPPFADYADVIGAGLARLPYPVRSIVEPGRALVAEAGTLTATVIGTADRFGRRWVHLDVGAFNGFMESLETGNRLRYPVSDSRGSARRLRCHLTGPTCDSQDTILFDVDLSADLATGDLVHIGSAGAYTSVYASSFNGFGPPTVRPIHGGSHEDRGTRHGRP